MARKASIVVDSTGEVNKIAVGYAGWRDAVPPTIYWVHLGMLRKNGIRNKKTGKIVSIPTASYNSFRNAGRKRPEESGFRGKDDGGPRLTGKLGWDTLEEFHKIYRGRLSGSRTQWGEQTIGWPDVPRADRMTEGVWRSLEFGLLPTGAATGAESTHVLPKRFQFLHGGYTMDPNEESSGKGRFVPRSKAGDTRTGSGYRGKEFLRNGFITSMERIEGTYQWAIENRSREFNIWEIR